MAERKSIPRETKIGLTVVFALLVMFVYVVINRVRETTVSEAEVSVVDQQPAPAPIESPETVQVASAVNQLAPEYTDNVIPPPDDAASLYQQAQTPPPELPADRYAFLPPQTNQSDEVAAVAQEQPATAEGTDKLMQQIRQDQVPSEYAAVPQIDATPAQFPLEEVQQQAAEVSQKTADIQQDVQQDFAFSDAASSDASSSDARQPPVFAGPDTGPATVDDRYAETNYREENGNGGEVGNSEPAYNDQQQEPAYVQQQQYADVPPKFDRGEQSQVAQVSQFEAPVGDYANRPQNGEYVVQPNDNFWTISNVLYGAGSYFKALTEYNRQRYPLPERLAVGDKVLAPPRSELIKLYPDLCPKERKRSRVIGVGTKPASDGKIYVVQEGDTLFDIARYELGDPSRWVEIYQLNVQQLTGDFDYVRPGLRLVLPLRGGRSAGSNGERFTQQPQGEPLRQ